MTLTVSATEPGASFCWHCAGPLSSYRAGGYAFTLLARRGEGDLVRVHNACVSDACNDKLVYVVGKTVGRQTNMPPSRWSRKRKEQET